MSSYFRSLLHGICFGVGFLCVMGSAVFAVNVSGNITSFVAGETISAALINAWLGTP